MAGWFHDTDIAEEKKNCLDSEKAMRDELAKEWSSFTPADKVACTNESKMGGELSYTELLTCLEMARDVRTMNADAAKPAAAPATSAPPGHASRMRLQTSHGPRRAWVRRAGRRQRAAFLPASTTTFGSTSR